MAKKDKTVDEQNVDQAVDEQNQVFEDTEMEEKRPEEKENNTQGKSDPQEEINALRKDYDELKDKYLRLFAEFDNYKKRTLKEKLEFMKTAAQDTMSALLPVLDDFDRAKKIAEDESTQETFSEGVQLVYNKIYSVLEQKGLEPMETDGQPFDPELHEAFTEIPAPTEDMKGKVVDTIEKGYFLKGKIIRHAKVVVGK